MRTKFSVFLASLLLPFTVSGGEATQSQLSELLAADDDSGFEKAIDPRAFVFPQDHGPHPGFRN
jgi:predicted secreted hydrolase